MSDAKEILRSSDVKNMTKTSLSGYHILSTEVEYADVKQRWIVVFSEKAYAREHNTLEKRINKEKDKIKKDLWHFSNTEFHCRGDGLNALHKIEKRWKYHKLKVIEVEEIGKKKGGGRGRPKKNEDLEIVHIINSGFEEDETAIECELLSRGKFIIATNELDCKKLTDEDALKAYKDQQHVERGFRFLKDPMFFAHSLFLKKESRIVAMVMVMGVALLLYSIAQKKLREALERENETLPDQKNKPTKKPTIRRIFQVFEGIIVLYDEKGKRIEVINMKPIHIKVLSLLGGIYEQMYCLDCG